MSDWKPGDVALCVDDRNYRDGGNFPDLRVGAKYTVLKSFVPPKPYLGPLGRGVHQTLLLLETKNRFAKTGDFCASRFVKQPPLVTEEETFSAAPIEKEGV